LKSSKQQIKKLPFFDENELFKIDLDNNKKYQLSISNQEQTNHQLRKIYQCNKTFTGFF
jgi:hypothetical protein